MNDFEIGIIIGSVLGAIAILIGIAFRRSVLGKRYQKYWKEFLDNRNRD